MPQLLATLQTLLSDSTTDDLGATAVEYGLMVSLIAVAIIVAVTTLGTNLVAIFTTVAASI